MPSCNTYHLTWVSVSLGVGYLFMAAPAKQVLLLTLDEGYLLTTTLPDLQCGIAPLGPPAPAQSPLLRLLLLAATPGLGQEMASPSYPWPQTWGSSSRLLTLTSGAGCLLLAATDLGLRVAPLFCSCAFAA